MSANNSKNTKSWLSAISTPIESMPLSKGSELRWFGSRLAPIAITAVLEQPGNNSLIRVDWKTDLSPQKLLNTAIALKQDGKLNQNLSYVEHLPDGSLELTELDARTAGRLAIFGSESELEFIYGQSSLVADGTNPQTGQSYMRFIAEQGTPGAFEVLKAWTEQTANAESANVLPNLISREDGSLFMPSQDLALSA